MYLLLIISIKITWLVVEVVKTNLPMILPAIAQELKLCMRSPIQVVANPTELYVDRLDKILGLKVPTASVFSH